MARTCSVAALRWNRIATLLALVALASGCGARSSPAPAPSKTSTTTAPSPDPDTATGIRLWPLTPREHAACSRLAASKPFPVVCPTLLPRPLPAAPPTPIGVYTFPICRAYGKPSGCPLYDFALLYGAPDERPGHAASNTPPAFLHFELLGGRDIEDAVGVHTLSGTRRLQRPLGRRTIAGHRGRLYLGLPYDRGGGELGSHYTFVWREGRWGYAASLHSWKPHTATLTVLAAIVAHLRTEASGAR